MTAAGWHGDLDHFEAFCKKLTLDNGRPFELQDFQRRILRDYFAGVVETLILLPKKNGKTTLMAALVVYHLVYHDEARCYVAASSRDQAALLYDHAKGFVNRSPSLQRRILVRGGTRELRSRRDDGFVKVLAADSDTADGVGPTLAIVDELHRHKSTALYDVFRDGLDARDGRMLTISTAGDDEDGPLGQMRANYLAYPRSKPKRGSRYTYARSPDGTNVMHEWALRPADDLEDLELVKSVNPLDSMTVAKLRRRRASPSMTTGTWARFACNVWTQRDDAAIAKLDWAPRGRERLRIPDGEESDVVVGIDLGWTKDSTALVPVGHPYVEADGDLNTDEAWIDDRLRIIPAGSQKGGKIVEGRMTDEELVKDALREFAELWPYCRFALDPNAGGQSLAQWIERELCGGDESRVVVLSQQPNPMALTSMHFAAGVRTRVVQEPPEPGGEELDAEQNVRTVPLWHPDHEQLNRHVYGAVQRWVGERWRFDKARTPSKQSTKVKPKLIDAAIAAALGYRALMAPRAEDLVPFAIAVGRR